MFRQPQELAGVDMVILPGSKNTLGDLGWLRESGMAHAVLQARRQGVPVLGSAAATRCSAKP
ncbi:cobyric acid synthase [Klebsiella michiganensis]|uniref:Cobyric acid synthase n=1 Tax=Klebsiella michiganensis TaxID=1134687 RepID=A0A7H4PIU7_9ENTR|nr:cobyric acid synthase [Klebsiella michiganensis]